jgi:hypothetical protein
MPQVALVGANGLKAWVIEVSGELSITRVAPVPLVLPVLLAEDVDPGVELVLGLEEHAARPTAVNTTAAAAMNRL